MLFSYVMWISCSQRVDYDITVFVIGNIYMRVFTSYKYVYATRAGEFFWKGFLAGLFLRKNII